jgi:hypothetical protein
MDVAFIMTLWSVHNETLSVLPKQQLDSEDRLETWIAQDISLLGMGLLIIGRQVITSFGGRIDLLAIDDEGDLVVIELKRDKTPREIVAQVLDYASWVNGLSAEEIDIIASAYLKKPLAEAFEERFHTALPENINTSHRMLIVASELDDSSERIVQYLSSICSLDINVAFFTCFQHDGLELVGRSWLMDPEQVEGRSEARRKSVKPTQMTWGNGSEQKIIPVGSWKDLLAESVSHGLQAGLPINKLPMRKKTSDATFDELGADETTIFLKEWQLHVLANASAAQIRKWVAVIRKELGHPVGFITVETIDGKKTEL